ncbi:hypothetical protein HNP84_000205 [Thermocatellispora tengchongensis]|uniref:Uncharacterized protein n=1 Tax=Thermocatellispora tengchongensis TaxID=1073253 RepID=A0A840NZT3_9ACTN|nr:hypothetical protein [Thermocatellispora tengchongensis]MBB5130517.1 hypothetical protein [Thermocatellispora tengchongensis]
MSTVLISLDAIRARHAATLAQYGDLWPQYAQQAELDRAALLDELDRREHEGKP